MYVKEDLILPHSTTFYELIINKARGKSGPLFNFDVHDDVRMVNDARVEKDESHAGKVRAHASTDHGPPVHDCLRRAARCGLPLLSALLGPSFKFLCGSECPSFKFLCGSVCIGHSNLCGSVCIGDGEAIVRAE